MATAREVANLFLEETDDPESVTPPRVMTIRLPSGRVLYVDSMAREAGVSRNAMVNHLLGVGIGAVMAELPDTIRDEIEEDVFVSANEDQEGF
mgnify:CR=1 FL=1